MTRALGRVQLVFFSQRHMASLAGKILPRETCPKFFLDPNASLLWLNPRSLNSFLVRVPQFLLAACLNSSTWPECYNSFLARVLGLSDTIPSWSGASILWLNPRAPNSILARVPQFLLGPCASIFSWHTGLNSKRTWPYFFPICIFSSLPYTV